ncbi:hypothetical protein [Sphingomonas sp.]|uniref:hypothetical protein n=1 Tax=Sphingomonas sp. TaxID=28214 RepID=UPI002DD63EED|nr:hypothetical protein [Sphingomonas sp.]
MTVHTPMEGLTAPRRAAKPGAPVTPARYLNPADIADDRPDAIDTGVPIEDFAAEAAQDGPAFTPSRRHDGWTADRQRAFLDYIAQGCTVDDAATLVGLSAASAYAFRQRAAGAAFAVGWQAALLLQRNRLADDLTSRAFRGQIETVIRPDGTQVERHRYDNRLALALLTRLDRIAAADLPDRTGDARAARLAAQDWERYLDLIADEASPARAGLFLALRVTEGEAAAIAPIAALARADLYRRTRAGHAGEIDTSDLDPATRAEWTAEQWARAEAAGLVTLAAPPPEAEPEPEPEDARGNSQLSQHSPGSVPADPVWWDDVRQGWRTRFPPPDGFDGNERGQYDAERYERDLTDHERDAWEAACEASLDRLIAADAPARDAFFASLAGLQADADSPRMSDNENGSRGCGDGRTGGAGNG